MISKPTFSWAAPLSEGLLWSIALVGAGLAACNKDSSSITTSEATATIAVTASQTAASSASRSADSVYMMQRCDRGSTRTQINESDLPAAADAYLTTNYPGYTFNKAFIIKNSSGVTTHYVAVIFFNDKPVGILFDSNGTFIKVLEQREHGDIDGPGWHDGGRFCDRDGHHRDTIALNDLPSVILGYMSANYPNDTLQKAFRNNHDSSYIIISKNNGLFATVFDVNGNFKRRVALPAPDGNCMSIGQSALPASLLNYLSTTYPNYVFEKAFAGYRNNVLKGYVVVINANNTRYAVRFDASGNFVSVKTIW